ncbi:MAG: GTP-binding protein [Lachnospiraceae bacterium]
MDEIQVPIYLLAGFLDAGKSSFLTFTIRQDYFDIDEPTLLILCEEGEIEYDLEALKKHNTLLEVVYQKEDFTPQLLQSYADKYNPGRVLLEFNGMWPVNEFHEMQLPTGWGVVQQIAIFDASTFQMYQTNMKSLISEMVKKSELVIFNRCRQELPLASFRRGVKVVNQGAEIIFENEKGEMDNIFADNPPYDLSAPVVDIAPEDYGIWYVDTMDHPERYKGKTIRLKAKVLKSRDLPSKFFVPGRMAMTCCDDDTTFLGYACKSAFAPKLSTGQWVEVTARMAYENLSVYKGEGFVLYAQDVQISDPLEEEMVYFN